MGEIDIGKIISCIITLVSIGMVNFGITLISDFSFIESSFFVGLISVVTIYFFTSSGGITSSNIDMKIQGETGIKVKSSEKKFYPSYAFFASIVYLIGAIVVTVIKYQDYFF